MAGSTALRLSISGDKDIVNALKAVGDESTTATAKIVEGVQKASAALRSMGDYVQADVSKQIGSLNDLAVAQTKAFETLGKLPAGGLKLGPAGGDLDGVKAQAAAMGEVFKTVATDSRDLANTLTLLQERSARLDPEYQRQAALAQARGEAARLLGAKLLDEGQAAQFLEASYRRLDPAYAALVASADRYRESVDPAIALDKIRAETLEQVRVGALTAAEATDKLTRALEQATGSRLDPGRLPDAVGSYVAVPSEAIEAARSYRGDLADVAAAERAEATATAETAAALAKKTERLEEDTAALRAFHGTAASFEQFDAAYAYTGGGGAQGHGAAHYFAENPNVAEYYAKQAAKKSGVEGDGNVLEVRLKVDPSELLDLNKKLSEQAPRVAEAFESVYQRLGSETAKAALAVGGESERVGRLLDRLNAVVTEVGTIDREATAARSREVSEALRQEGVAGFSYASGRSDSARNIGIFPGGEDRIAIEGAQRYQATIEGVTAAEQEEAAATTATGQVLAAKAASAENAIAAVQRQAAQDRILVETEQEVDAALKGQQARAEQLRATLDPLIAVKKLQAETDLLVANNALKVEEAEKLVAVATERANAQARASSLAGGQGLFGSARSYEVAIAASQLQDFTVQLQNGTSFFTTFAEQAPQLGYAFGSIGIIIGTVVGVATALVGVIFHLSESHEAAKKAADAQQQALDGLSGKFDLSAKGADELVASYGRLTAAQQGLISANLSAAVDTQTTSLKALKEQLDATVPSAERAQHGAGFLGSIANFLGQGAQVAEGTVGAPAAPQPEDANIELQRRVAQRALDDFEKTGQGADSVRTALLALAQARGEDAAAATKTADAGVVAATAYYNTKQARDLLIAQQAVLHGNATQEQQDLLGQAEALKTAAVAAKNYKASLADIQRQTHVAGLSPDEQSIANAVQKAGGDNLTETQKADIELAEGRRLAAQHEAEDNKKLKASEQELADQRRQLADAGDKYAAVGDRVAAAKRRELGEDLAQSDAGKAQIEQARQIAVEAAKAADARSASSKAVKGEDAEAAAQAKYAASVHEGLVAAQQAVTDAQRGGTAASREAIATRQAEVEVQGRQIALSSSLGQRLVEERTQTILLTQAAQDRLKFEQQLQALRTQGADADVQGRDASGAVLSADALRGLDTAALKEAEDRANAVRKAIDEIPESVRNGADGIQAIAEKTSAALHRFDADLAKNQGDAATNLLAQSRQEAAYAQQRIAAEQQEPAVRQQLLAQLAAENELLAKGITLNQIRYDPKYIAAYAQLTRDNLVKSQEQTDAALKKRQQDLTDDIIAQPFKDLASTIGGSLTEGLDEFETKGLPGLFDSLTSFTGKLRGIGNQFASNLLTLPLNSALAEFQVTMQKQGSGAALSQLFQNHPIVAGLGVGGVIGGIGGGIAQQITGNPNSATGGSFGGLAGGVAGTLIGGPVGGIIGGALGTALGSVLGGFFGGGSTGKNNDAQGFIYSPYTGAYTKTDKQGSPQNTQASRQLAEQASGALDILGAAGLDYGGHNLEFKVGNNSGVEYDRKNYASNQDALKAAIRDLIDNTTGTITDTLKTVLANTKAESAQQLQQDIAFAATYDQLTNKTGAYGQALVNLDTQYRTAEAQAKKLGLSTDDLASALAEAERDLKDKAVQQLKALIGDSGAAGQAIFDLRQKFKDVAKDAVALGYTQQQLAAGEAKQEAKLREQYHYQAEALIGAFGPLGQSILQIRNNFDQARQIFLDLGESVEGLAQKQAAAERKAYADAAKQLQQQLSGQAQQVRGFLDGLVNPLKQALSGLGPLASFVAPQQTIAAGLAEFRKTFASAGKDNVAAIQGLPQEAEQLLQLARSSLGSGPQFAEIFAEVQRDLQSVLTAQQGRADPIEATLPSSEQTAQQQLDALQSGFQDTVDALARLHDDWRQLGGVLAAPANVNAQLDAGSVAAAFAPQLAAQQQGNTLIAGVSDAVRLVGNQQTDAIARMTATLVDRFDRLERKLDRLQPGRLGNAA